VGLVPRSLRPPPAGPDDLRGFPAITIASADRCYRHALGPWWFSCDHTSRFDLDPPNGTMYLASERCIALIEVLRSEVIAQGAIDARRFTTIAFPRPLSLADCTSGLARGFGVTAEIHDTVDYDATAAWANAFSRAGFDGIAYFARHDPSHSARCFAVFSSISAPPPGTATPGEVIGDDAIDELLMRFGVRVEPEPGR
jgi:hypothetical protein